ncbi:HD domain-containing protein [Pyrodictium abyssi]|uniref:HD domain-containing protein n=1 Tax=Pyrodictium abyssi TaxID=54256 RepID=UPI0030C7831A
MECRRLLEDKCLRSEWCRELLKLVKSVEGGDEAHGFPHTLRVLCRALKLAEGKNVDYRVLVASALLHDIGRPFENQAGVHHAALSAFMARLILPGLGFSPEEVARVERAILEHSFSLSEKNRDKPGSKSSIESCILSDADKLDALGAVGAYRLVETSAQRRRSMRQTLAHYHEKLSKLPDYMCTEEARREAAQLLERLRSFVEWLYEESKDYFDLAEAVDKAFPSTGY